MDPHINPASGVWDDNYFASTQKGGGGSVPAAQQFPDVKLADVGGSAVDFAKTLNQGEDAIFNSYANKAASTPKPLDLFNMMEEKAGIPGLRTTQSTLQSQIYDIEDTLRRVEPDIAARSGNSIVTEAQRRGMVSAAKEPLTEKLGWLGQSAGRVSNAITQQTADIGNRVGLAMEGFRMELEPYKDRLALVTDQNARTMTGFSSDRQATLDLLVRKIERGLQVSDMERQQAIDLAKEERSYTRSMEQIKMEMNQPDNKIVEANGRQLLVNMATGETIADLGSTKEPATGGGAGGYGYYPSNSEWEIIP